MVFLFVVLFIYLFGRHEYLYFYCYPDGLLGYLLNELHELIQYVAKLIRTYAVRLEINPRLKAQTR